MVRDFNMNLLWQINILILLLQGCLKVLAEVVISQAVGHLTQSFHCLLVCIIAFIRQEVDHLGDLKPKLNYEK